MSNKKKYIKMPPETQDGSAWVPYPVKPVMLGESNVHALTIGEHLMAWAHENAEVGDRITIEIIELTDDEFEALPEI